MGAMEDSPKSRIIQVPPEEITRGRRLAEQITGHKFPPGPGEIEAYEKAGLEPPVE